MSKKKTKSTPTEGATTVEAPAPVTEGAEAIPDPAVPEAGTTDALFPDFQQPEGEITPPEAVEIEGATQEEPEGTPETKEEQAPTSPPASPKHLSLDEYGDALIMTNVDGVKIEKPLKDVLKGYQLESHLTKKGQAIAAAAKELEEKKAAAQAPPPQEPLDALYPDEDAEILAKIQAQTKPLVDKITTLETQLAGAAPAVGEIQYQHDIKALDANLKERGLTDFMDYVPIIEEHVFSLPVEEQIKARTFDFYENQYKTLKLLNPIKPAEPSAPAEPKDMRPAPPVAPIESGGGRPSAPVDEGQSAKLKALRAKAMETGRTRDWAEYMREAKL